MQTIVISLTVTALLVSLYYFLIYIEYRRMQKNMALKARCSIFVDEERRDAIIIGFFDNTVIVEDEYGEPHYIHRSEVYPPRKLARR